MHKENFNTKSMVEAGLISSLIVVIMLMTVYVPLFSLLGTFILPIPVTVLYLRHNGKVTLGAVVVSAILIAMLYSPISALTSSILFGATGITLGYCIKNKKKVWITLVMLAVVSALCSVIDFSIYVTFISKDGFTGFVNQNLQIMKESIDTASKMGMSQAQLEQIKKSYEIFTPEFILELLPTMLLIAGSTSAYINYIVARSILKRFKYEIEPVPPFSTLYINNRVGTVILIIVIVGTLMDRGNMLGGKYVLVSSQLILQMVLLIQGIAVASYYLRNKLKMSKLFTLLIILLTASTAALSMIYISVGLMDMIFDFRKLDPFRRKKAQ